MKTLYLTDLDGTLLRSDEKTSSFTNDVINRLVSEGMIFSYATARSYNTSHKVAKGMTASFPIIIYNGAFIRDNATGELLTKNFPDKDRMVSLLIEMKEAGIEPIVYSFVNGEEKLSYRRAHINKATLEFTDSRKGDKRDRPIETWDELIEGDIFYITCIDSPEKLEPFYKKYDNEFHCVYQIDIYSGEQWLEIMDKHACKADASLQLKEMLGCDKMVVFGDGANDIDMFEVADESYAVANAAPELKEKATGVIGPNDEDSVAKWLEERI